MSATVAPPEVQTPPPLAPLDALAWTRRPEPPKREIRLAAGVPLLALPVARFVAFAALALWGSLHWMRMLEPSEPKRGWAIFVVSLAGAGLMLLAGRFTGRRRALVVIVSLIGLLALMFLAGRVANELLLPTNWGELEGGIARGISDLPGVRVPYRGLDQWVRTVIPLGGSFLVLLAAVLAFFPRRKPATLGFRWAALLVLLTLFVVPVISIGFFHAFVRGAVLTLLVIVYVTLEKVRRPDALAALGLVLLTVLVALVVAPMINLDQPWWDYETWALETSSSKSTTYDWDANYNGLNWPRDGRELLRIRAKQPAYWKAENLDVFDGSRWVRSQIAYAAPEYPKEQPKTVKTWTQKLRVSVRNLRTDEFITAGYAFNVQIPRLLTVQTLDGIFMSPRTLRRGDAYTTEVYTPHPSQNQRRRAGTDYDQQLEPYTTLYMTPTRLTGAPRRAVEFPFFGDQTTGISVQPPVDQSADEIIARSGLQRTYELSLQLLEGARTPDDYVQRVLNYLAQPQFSYSEQPPASAHTLDGFLFDAKTGYCQQYAGAMALLLRMAGIPARVSTGFSTGATDTKTGEYVVRDYDAHAWVEVYYPGIGWLTFDPTPAASPARSQPQDAATHTSLNPSSAPTLGDPLSERGASTAVTAPGAPWWRWPAFVIALLAAFAAGFLGVRRQRRGALPAMSELERALKRTRRELAPGTTLHALELRFAETPAAAGYVRALRESRYRDQPSRPTRAQRRGLRSELGRGRGILGRLRAWWALPPR